MTVRKPDGSYRFCIDYRGVNASSKVCADPPPPYMDEILRKLQSAKYISVIDLSNACHQKSLTEDSKHLTAFTVPGIGLFKFNRLSYGVAGGPATFQELSDILVGPEMEPYAFSYLDDTVVVVGTIEDHPCWLERVLTRIKEAGLTINREKSKFRCSEVRFLGALVNLDGLKPDPDKIQPIIDYPRPKNLKQITAIHGHGLVVSEIFG